MFYNEGTIIRFSKNFEEERSPICNDFFFQSFESLWFDFISKEAKMEFEASVSQKNNKRKNGDVSWSAYTFIKLLKKSVFKIFFENFESFHLVKFIFNIVFSMRNQSGFNISKDWWWTRSRRLSLLKKNSNRMFFYQRESMKLINNWTGSYLINLSINSHYSFEQGAIK